MAKRRLYPLSLTMLFFWLCICLHVDLSAQAKSISEDNDTDEDVALLEQTLAASADPEYSKIDETLNSLPKALLTAQRLKRYQDKIDLMIHGAKLHERKGEIVEAENYWRSAIRLVSERRASSEKGLYFVQYAQFLRINGKPDEAIEALEQASETFRAAREAPLEIETRLEIAMISAEEGLGFEAIDNADAAVSSATALNDITILAKTYQAKGMVEMILGATCQRDLGHFVINKIQLLHQREPIISDEEVEYNNAALESLQTAINYCEEAGDDAIKADCLRMKGDIMLHMHKLPVATNYYQDAYRLFSSSGKSNSFLLLQLSMAIRQTMEQKIDTALRTVNAAISTNETEANTPWLLLVKAEIELKDFNDPEAKTTLEGGLVIAEKNQDLDQLIALNQLLSLVEINLGNYRNGFAALDKATQHQVRQISKEKEQVELARDQDLDQLEKSISKQVFQRTRELEDRLYNYEAFVKNAWIMGITFVACFVGLLLLRSRNTKEVERKLYEAKTELLEANEALKNAGQNRNALFRSFAQELRTPMNGIVGAIPLLDDGNLTPLQENCANIIDISSRSITTLINDISDLSLMESGKFALAKTKFSIVHVVESVVQLFEADASHSDIGIFCEVPSDPVEILHGDPNRIQQVLIAIMGRSLQTTYEGMVTIKLERLVPSSEHKRSFHITIEDTGSSPDSDKLDDFFEINPNTTGGSSLLLPSSMVGMSIARKLVDAMKGSITVEKSNLGGIRIELILPFVHEDASQTWETPAAFERFPRKRVLIIDSSDTSAKILAKHMRAWALHFEVVDDVNSASQLLEGPHGFDAIFLDCVSPDPDLNLLEQISAIRSNVVAATTPILLLSQFSNFDNSLELKRIKYIHQVSKPFLVEQLHTVLSQALHFKSPVSKSYAKLTPEIETVEDIQIAPEKDLGKTAAGFQFMPYLLPTRTNIEVDANLRILLAEDNAVNQKVTTLMLKKMGFEIKVVPNGKQAVEAAGTGEFDVVLMDKIMPVMGGLEACGEIRKIETIDQPIIIALTASATMEDEIACRKATMDNFLAKPVSLEKMKAALGFATKILQERRIANEKNNAKLEPEAVEEAVYSPGAHSTEELPANPPENEPEPQQASDTGEALEPTLQSEDQPVFESETDDDSNTEQASTSEDGLEIETSSIGSETTNLIPMEHSETDDEDTSLDWPEQVDSLEEPDSSEQQITDVAQELPSEEAFEDRIQMEDPLQTDAKDDATLPEEEDTPAPLKLKKDSGTEEADEEDPNKIPYEPLSDMEEEKDHRQP